jgi:peptidyl-dipeptidase Dcp
MGKAMLFILASMLIPPMVAAQTPPPPAQNDSSNNPFFQEWTTPFQVPPFQLIKEAHFLPAFKEAVSRQRSEVEAIADSTQTPTFANTIEALDKAGEMLSKVNSVFSNLNSAETNDRLQAINREVAPMLSALRDDKWLNAGLFKRIKTVWDQREQLKLSAPQQRLLEDTYKSFVRGGANLDPVQKERLRKINTDLSMLGIKFGENLLKETNSYRLVIENQADLAGLPSNVTAAAADAARTAGLSGKWLFGLQAPSIWPFLQYADNRELRRQILTAYTTRCDHGDQYDNKSTLVQIATLRAEKAQLLGYKTHADFVLEDNMAKTPARVLALLNQLWTPARGMALKESAVLQEMIQKEGGPFTLQPWDWRYFTEKVRKARYSLDEQDLRQYFQLDRVRDGAFYVAKKLYGITVIPRPDLPVYHPEVKAFEVKDRDGSHLGVFYADYHPRPGKRVGAWSSRFREQSIKDGREIRPIVVNVCNFTRPSGSNPALLSLEEVATLFHEFGHGLHSLFARVPYRSLSSVPRDFVELPSQIMENWALEPEVLKVYARHHITGQVIPKALIDKIKQSEKFDQGFATVEYLAASLLDMDWHLIAAGQTPNATEFEQKSMAKIQMLPEIFVRYRSPYFNHIFGPGGSYSAGYYSYIWSEVLDADAFQAFKEKGIFDQKTAHSFRTNILERGGSEDAMTLYKRFRGAEPKVEPLLARRGLK